MSRLNEAAGEGKVDRSCVDCAAGRRIGCQSFCCRLLVRLSDQEIEERAARGLSTAGLLEKDENGYCVHFVRETGRCGIWADRPQTCRDYECNSDFMLQVVLRDGFKNLADAARATATAYIPKEKYRQIPLLSGNAKRG